MIGQFFASPASPWPLMRRSTLSFMKFLATRIVRIQIDGTYNPKAPCNTKLDVVGQLACGLLRILLMHSGNIIIEFGGRTGNDTSEKYNADHNEHRHDLDNPVLGVLTHDTVV